MSVRRAWRPADQYWLFTPQETCALFKRTLFHAARLQLVAAPASQIDSAVD